VNPFAIRKLILYPHYLIEIQCIDMDQSHTLVVLYGGMGKGTVKSVFANIFFSTTCEQKSYFGNRKKSCLH